MTEQKIKVKGTQENLEAFRAYFESPPRIEAATIKDGDGDLVVTVQPRHAEFIKCAAEYFGCTAKIRRAR